MRSEKEMLELILKFAQQNENIRAVYINGSRANPNIEKDIFQDYDIVYVVKDTKAFIGDKSWIRNFGEIAVMQEPDDSNVFSEECNDPTQRYNYLMQFVDGTRIDLSYISADVAIDHYLSDKLTVLLLDKDKLFPALPVPSDEDYCVKKPELKNYKACCNEFWWLSTYVAKGLRRNQILYAIDHLNFIRAELIKIVEWQVGFDNNFSVNTGSHGKFLKTYLKPDDWKRILETYPTAEIENVWEPLMKTVTLFEETAKYIGNKLSFSFNEEECSKTKRYLLQMRNGEIK
jgi:aminoglycoside 6-adenylyltransferase